MKCHRLILRRVGYALGVLPSTWQLPSAIKIVEWRQAGRCLPPAGTDGVVLDVGCGAAIQSQLLDRRGEKAIGVDPAYPHLQFAADLRRLAGRRVHISLINGTTEAVATGSCDTVISLGVLEHTTNPRHVISECARVLRPGGRLVLTADTQNGGVAADLLERFRAAYDVRTFFDQPKVENLLADAGFKGIETRYILRSGRSLQVLARLLDGHPEPGPVRRVIETRAIERAERRSTEVGGQMVLATARR